MSQKTPTVWNSNPLKFTGLTAYSDSTVTYSSSTTSYSSATASLDDFGKLPTAWTTTAKTATIWQANPSASTSLYVFDSAAHTYDSTVDTYDGVVAGQDFTNQNTPTAWSSL